jgi:unsaturated chondroitin disaccharide hydrolase
MINDIAMVVMIFLMVTIGATGANAQADKLPLDRVWQFAQGQLKQTVMEWKDSVQYPRCTGPDGKWITSPIQYWTSGFFPGCLWYAFEQSGDPSIRAAAMRWTAGLEPIQYFKNHHDVGFMIFSSYGNGYRLTKNSRYKDVILQTARSLMTRYNPVVGCIKSWDNRRWPYPVIIDNMMNLELLFWASQNGGTKEMYDAAVSHAVRTMQNHFRPDYSSYHVIGYDATTGGVLSKGTNQGYADSSCWARGQAWAIYGFTMSYRFTKDPRFLQTAQRAADYFISHLPADDIPFWDFQAPGIPNEPRDVSAAAITSSALLELLQYTTEPTLKNRYREAAEKMLRSLCSSAYLAEGTTSHAILNHSVGSKPAKAEVDVSLIYADYYFLEAMLRYAQQPK